MARPNNQAAIHAHITGLREAKAAFQAMPEILRDELNFATEATVKAIARAAKAHLVSSPSIRTRMLFNHINWTLNKKSGLGRVGVGTGSTVIRNPSMGTIGRNTVRVKGIIIHGGGASGQLRARIVRPSRYAHLVEFGTKNNMPAEPFMVPSADAEKKPYIDRCRAAGKKLEQKMAQIGGGGRHL